MKKLLIVLGALTVMLIATNISMADVIVPEPGAPSGEGIQPYIVGDNPDCADLSCFEGYEGLGSFKIDSSPTNGPYNVGSGTVTISNADGTYFDWGASGVDILAVIVKGGSYSNVYEYIGTGLTSDTGLHSPINPNNERPYGLSHVTFCYNVPEPGILLLLGLGLGAVTLVSRRKKK